jgi:hypothetical protein
VFVCRRVPDLVAISLPGLSEQDQGGRIRRLGGKHQVQQDEWVWIHRNATTAALRAIQMMMITVWLMMNFGRVSLRRQRTLSRLAEPPPR